MDPGWTQYKKTCLFSTYDVSSMITAGENAIGVFLGNGMYNKWVVCACFLCMIWVLP